MSTQTPSNRPLDTMPVGREVLAAMTPEERSALYLNSIRKTLMFLAILAAVAVVAGLVMGFVAIGAIHGAAPGSGI